MRKIYTLLALLVFAIALQGQGYYVLPIIDPGYNPGQLNMDSEDINDIPGLGWTQIMGTTTTDQWSSNESIPFSFNFDGNIVSNFKVSNSGVLTFTTSASTVPGTSNQALPSTSIPNKSVCVWGLDLSGNNDAIYRKTFGQAPNRQLWVQWASASEAAYNNGYTYWSIVMEETTNRIYIVDQRTGGGPRNGNIAITAGVQVDGSTATQVAGSPNLGSEAGNSGTPDDNFYYEFGQGFLAGNDMKGEAETVPKFVEVNKPVSISGLFLNRGNVPLFSADMNYRVNGGNTVTGNLSSFNVGTGYFAPLAHPTPWTPTTPGKYSIKFWIDNINNGGVDQNPGDDTITIQVQAGVATSRKMLVEQFGSALSQDVKDWNDNLFTSAFAGYNTSNSDKLVIKYQVPLPNSGDPSHNQDADDRMDYYNVRSVPATLVNGNRIMFTGGGGTPNWTTRQQQFTTAETQGVNEAAFVEINNAVATYDGQGNSADLTVTANIKSNVDLSAGAYRAQVILMNKAYTYAGAPNGETDYHHVMRKMMPGPGGIPLNMAASGTKAINQSQNNLMVTNVNEMTYDLWNHNIEVVILVEDTEEQKVMNAALASVNLVGLEEAGILAVKVYPNPASDKIIIALAGEHKLQLQLINSTGQLVMERSYSNTQQAVVDVTDQPEGMYFLKLLSDKGESLHHIAILH